MVFGKLKELFSKDNSEEKYEVLFHRYSKVKLENQRLRDKNKKDLEEMNKKLEEKFARNLINIFQDVESAKNSTFKISATNKEIQNLFLDINKTEKNIKKLFEEFGISEIRVKDNFFDPNLHEVASYEDTKDGNEGTIVKTIKKGFKYKGKIIAKPKVVVRK